MVVIDILPADPANPINHAPAIGDGVGFQPFDQSEAVNEAVDLPPLPPINAKKRKPNASGSRKCSGSWNTLLDYLRVKPKIPLQLASIEVRNIYVTLRFMVLQI